MQFKKSFDELKKPMTWLHYALGTLIFYGITLVIPNFYKINLFSTVWLSLLVFFATYVLVDRTSHAVLGFN